MVMEVVRLLWVWLWLLFFMLTGRLRSACVFSASLRHGPWRKCRPFGPVCWAELGEYPQTPQVWVGESTRGAKTGVNF